jgi:N-methylhydantoinase A/acetophenone carboxylase
MASAIKREVHLRGYHPEDFALFAYGGGGPTHVAGYRADVPTAVIFPQAPVFSALGSSVMDIMHVYEQSGRLQFMAPMTEQIVIDREAFNQRVRQLMDRARQDLQAQGLAGRDVVFSVELDMLYGGLVQVKRVSCPVLSIESDDDAQRVYDDFEKEFAEAFSPHVINKPGGVYIDGIVLKATVVTEKLRLPVHPLQGTDPAAARTSSRSAYWPEFGERRETDVYSFDTLRPGNVVTGPAIAEMEYSTIVIPPGQQCRIDPHGLGIIEDAGRAGNTSPGRPASAHSEVK